ncbi:MAG: hypothetical protein WDA12_04920 [Bacilli bacterium]
MAKSNRIQTVKSGQALAHRAMAEANRGQDVMDHYNGWLEIAAQAQKIAEEWRAIAEAEAAK